jgi:uncharacterized membrane protein
MVAQEHTKRLPKLVSVTLQIGAVVALALILLGLALAAGRGTYIPGQAPVMPLAQLLQPEQIGSPLWVLNLGLLALMLTPVLGLLAAALSLALERDWRYLLVTLVVLAVIYVSTLVAR